jgi:hypothetical protein
MRQWVEQPIGTNTCGQVAIAVLAGISLEEAIKLVGKKGCTSTKDLVKALRSLGFKCPNRCKKMPRPTLGLGQVRCPERKSGWHWVVVDGIKIFDGTNGDTNGNVIWGHTWKMTSFLPITERD